MLYCYINYYYNIFFILNNKYYIYFYVKNLKYIYNFELINNDLFLIVTNKDTKIKEQFDFKIMYDDKEVYLQIFSKQNKINVGNINNFKYVINNDNNNKITIHNYFFENNFDELFPNFSKEYYIKNNKLINKDYISNNKYIIYHWYLCGQYQPQLYFKYLLKKYSEIIMKIKYPIIKYSSEKKNTLLFIDDRYDPSFIYLLILFLYSVDISWNITIYTTEDNKKYFQDDLNKLKITGNILLLNNHFHNINHYSDFLKDENTWKLISEENCLLFQYDSFSMGKFDTVFFDYNYIGARWPHKASTNENINIGNGGTSFRKTRIMEMICNKNKDNIKMKECAEDIFFSELLYEENLLNCTNEIADRFSFENIYNDYSVYAHQIYNTIELCDLDNFVYKNINAMYESYL
jgi:hypothetical protein